MRSTFEASKGSLNFRLEGFNTLYVNFSRGALCNTLQHFASSENEAKEANFLFLQHIALFCLKFFAAFPSLRSPSIFPREVKDERIFGVLRFSLDPESSLIFCRLALLISFHLHTYQSPSSVHDSRMHQCG